MWQYITMTKRIFLIDCPGIVYQNKDTETDVVLKGVVCISTSDIFLLSILQKTKHLVIILHLYFPICFVLSHLVNIHITKPFFQHNFSMNIVLIRVIATCISMIWSVILCFYNLGKVLIWIYVLLLGMAIKFVFLDYR